jgi:hypothetical protein
MRFNKHIAGSLLHLHAVKELLNHGHFFRLHISGLKELQVFVLPLEEITASTIALLDNRPRSVARKPLELKNAH